MPSESLSLYRLEDDLAVLVETGEAGVPPEIEAQYRRELSEALARSVEKRDRVGQFIHFIKDQAEFAAEEIKRLTERKRLLERAEERVRAYVRWTIESLGQDEQGKFRRLEGKTVTFSLRKLADTLLIDDEAAIPAVYKTLLIEVPATAWERHFAVCADKGILAAITRTEVKIDRRGLLAHLKEGAEVPGADIRLGEFGLQLR
jgi:hypothetical protein